MPTVVPALPFAPPPSSPVGTGAFGDLFAALVQQLSAPPGIDVALATPAGTAAPGGTARSLATAGAEPVLTTDTADPEAMTDATTVPALLALPASTPPPVEPPTLVTAPSADGRPAATATTSDRSVAAVAPSVCEPPVREGRELAVTPSLAADHSEEGSQRVAAATVVAVPRASAPTGDPAPPAPARLPEPAASDRGASARPLAPRDGPSGVAWRSNEPIGAMPIAGSAEAQPVATAPRHSSPTTLSMASASSGTGRKGQDHHAATVPHGAADGAVATGVADRTAAVRIDPPIEPTTTTLPGDARAEGARGLLPSAGPAPLASDWTDAGPVVLSPQLTVAIVRQAADGLDRVKVQLQPEELGTIEIALELGDDGRARAAFLAERPETVDLLRREAGDLERALRQVGVEVASGDMSFAPRNPHGGRDQEPGSRVPIPHGDPEPMPARHGPSPTTSRGVSARLLDLTV